MHFTHGSFIQRVLIATGLIIALLLFTLLLWQIQQVLYLLFAGILAAILLRHTSVWVSGKTRLQIKWSFLVVLSSLILLLAALVLLLGPAIADQANRLFVSVPEALKKLAGAIGESPTGRILFRNLPEIGTLAEGFAGILSRATGVLFTTIGILASFVAVLFLGIYMALEPELYIKGTLLLFPPSKRDRAGEVIGALGDVLHWWLIGTFLDMLFVGILTWVGLWMLGIPLGLTLGLFAGLLTFIPIVGPIVSAVPAILMGFANSISDAVYVSILFLAIQIVESYFLMPLIQKKTVSLPPVLTLVAITVMGILSGMTGAIFATPLMAAIVVLVKMLYVEEVLDESPDLEGAEKNR